MFSNIVNAQNTGISVVGIQAGDIDKYMPSGINLMNLEISPPYDKTKLSIDIHNFYESTETVFVDTLIKRENPKRYLSIEQSKDCIIIKYTQIGVFTFIRSVKTKYDKKINAYEFKSKPNAQNKTMLIALLVDNEAEDDLGVKSAISRILSCQQLNDIKKDDIGFLKKKSDTLIVLTYKMEPIE